MSAAFTATRWVIISSFGFRIIGYIGQFIILRLVAKDVFGFYGSLIDIHMMALVLFPLAIDSLLIREKARRIRFAVALGMSGAAIGMLAIFVALMMVLLPTPGAGSFAARVGGDPDSWKAIFFMAPIFAIMSTKLTARTLLSADLNFRRISAGEFGNGIITYFGGAAAVYFSRTAWALMAAYMCGELFECLWLYRGGRFHPSRFFEPRTWRIFHAIVHRHGAFCFTNTADTALNNIGSLIPGPMILSLISEEASADFRLARMLIQLPILLLVGAIWRVAYPTISGVSEDVLKHRCLRIIGTTAAFLVPAVIWLAFFAPATVHLIGGKNYATAEPLIRWMALYMGLAAIFSPISSLDMIRDKSEWGLYWNVVHTFARITVICIFASHGLAAVVIAMSITSFVLWIVWAWMLGVLLRAGLGKFAMAVIRFAPFWILLGAGFYGCAQFGDRQSILAPALSAIPCLIYAAVVMKLFPGEAEMIWKLAGRKTRP
ncbi:hypothetical protein BH09SUM1_BH09SUM1_27380 [soil metagenome]